MNAALQVGNIELRQLFATSEIDVHNDDVIIQSIKEISLSRHSIFKRCTWLSKSFDCHQFKVYFTEKGLCFTYNMINSHEMYTQMYAHIHFNSKFTVLIVDKIKFTFRANSEIQTVYGNPNVSDWSLEKELMKINIPHDKCDLVVPSYPHHVFRADSLDSLTLTLNFNLEDYFGIPQSMRPNAISFSVYLHRPDAAQNAFLPPIEVEVGKKAAILMTPRVFIATDAVRKYDPKRRRCAFTSEYQLKYFQSNTIGNCELECLTDFVKNECGCVKFSMISKIFHCLN